MVSLQPPVDALPWPGCAWGSIPTAAAVPRARGFPCLGRTRSPLGNSRRPSPVQGQPGIPPRHCDRPWGRWQIPVLRPCVRFEVRSLLGEGGWCGTGAPASGWAAQTRHKTFPSPGFLLANGPGKGSPQIQQCVLLRFLELAYLHTSYNYHLHSQRHLLEMG